MSLFCKQKQNKSQKYRKKQKNFGENGKISQCKKIDRAPKNTYLTILSGHIDLKQNE